MASDPTYRVQGAEDGIEETMDDDPYGRAIANLDQLKEAPTTSDLQMEKRARSRWQRAILAVIALALIGGYLFTYFVSRQVARAETRSEIINATVQSLQETNSQREQVGLPPIDVDAVAARIGQQGVVDAITTNVLGLVETDPRFRGVAGAPGTAGDPGEPGISGVPGAGGAQGPQGVPGDPGATGVPGTPGEPGAAGTNGSDGTPGTNGDPGPQGPQGEQGPEGDQGPQGEQGPRGPQGDQGVAGDPGPSCPDGSAIQRITVMTSLTDSQTIDACVVQ